MTASQYTTAKIAPRQYCCRGNVFGSAANEIRQIIDTRQTAPATAPGVEADD